MEKCTLSCKFAPFLDQDETNIKKFNNLLIHVHYCSVLKALLTWIEH